MSKPYEFRGTLPQPSERVGWVDRDGTVHVEIVPERTAPDPLTRALGQIETITAGMLRAEVDDTEGVELARERSEPALRSRGRSSTADIRESARSTAEGGSNRG